MRLVKQQGEVLKLLRAQVGRLTAETEALADGITSGRRGAKPGAAGRKPG